MLSVKKRYFVSNYPPFSFWTPEAVGDVHDALGRPPNPDTPLGLYVHIPFCRKRCHFCYFKVYTDKNAAAIQAYIDAVIAEMKLYADRAFVGGGSLPGFELDTWVVALRLPMGAERFAERLRRAPVPVLASVREDLVLFDVRTLLEGDETALEQVVVGILGASSR